jgi:two-component system chemotaxis response regulator CheB
MNWNEIILIGASAGGLKALSKLLSYLPEHFVYPILVVQHIQDGSSSYLADYLNEQTPLVVKEAEDKEMIQRGFVYLAPPGYHMLVELDKTISLSVDPRVNFSRPSIDVLFESGAYVMEQHCKGIVLTGSNRDGSAGLKRLNSMEEQRLFKLRKQRNTKQCRKQPFNLFKWISLCL